MQPVQVEAVLYVGTRLTLADGPIQVRSFSNSDLSNVYSNKSVKIRQYNDDKLAARRVCYSSDD